MSDAPETINWAEGVPLTAGPFFLGLYQPSPETVDFWDGVKAGELRLKWCDHCKKHLHPKRIVCPDCGSHELGSKVASGKGAVYSFSEVHRAALPALADSVPYTVGVVKLEEGVHLFTRFFAAPNPVAVDAPARLEFRPLELGHTMPVFLV